MSKYLRIVVLLLCILPSNVIAGVFDFVQPGTWHEVPNSKLNTYTSVYPPIPTPAGSPSNVFVAWGGGLFDTQRNRLVVHGGGHADYAGNEIYAFTFSTLSWTRLTNPTPASQVIAEANAYADGNPTSVHSYDALLYIPGLDKYWRGGGSRWGGSGGGTRMGWYFNPTTSAWASLGTNNAMGVSGCTEYDAQTNTIYAVRDNSASGKYSVGSGLWSNWGDLGGIAQGEEQTCAIDPDTRQFVMIGNGKAISMHLDTGVTVIRSISGDKTAQNGRGPGLQWHPILRKLVGWYGGTNVYSLDTTTWSWSVHSPAGSNTVTPPTVSNSRILGGFPFSKFQYVPSEDVFVLVNTSSSSVYVYRMLGGTVPPPDTTNPTVSITAPVEGATVNGSISVTATALDNVGVVGVQFKLDGLNTGMEDTTAPYSYTWATTTTTNGTHTLSAVARDAAGNQATHSISVLVSQGTTEPPLPPPTGLVVAEASTSNSSTTGQSMGWAVDCPNDNRLLLVGLALISGVSANVTTNGQPLSQVGFVDNQSGGKAALFALPNPPLGQNSVLVSQNYNGPMVGGAICFSNTNTSVPLGTLVGGVGNSSAVTLSVASTTQGGLLFDVLSSVTGGLSYSANSGQTIRHALADPEYTVRLRSSTKPSVTGSTSIGWTVSSSFPWAAVAVEVRSN